MALISINFQFGEFISEHQNDFDPTVLITISLFFLGYFINECIKRVEILRKSIETQEYLFVSLQSLIIAIRKKAFEIDKLRTQVKDKKTISSYYYNDTLGFHTENIEFLNREIIYSALVANQAKNFNLNSKSFVEIFDRIEKINKVILEHPIKMEAFFKKSDFLSNEIDKSIEDIQELFFNYLRKEAEETGNHNLSSPLLIKIDEIIYTWQQAPNFTNYYIKEEMLFKPLQNIIRDKKVSEFRSALKKPVMHGLNNLINYKRNRNLFAHDLAFQKETLLRGSVKIKYHFNLLYKQKSKKVLWIFPMLTKLKRSLETEI
ncbi:MAG TPA: hypothetical protein PKN75_12225 [Bacteroidia bacterium]|nr:hypothetical protein [Bacteroidia bacterium]HNU34344.1 hypothetical protein [Bacteroidia bacterium]